MVRHTLKSLGPKVLADRMVRDYVEKLYSPAAHSSRTLNGDYAGAQRARRRGSTGSARAGRRWPSTTSSPAACADAPEIGDDPRGAARSSRWAHLSPEDVDVQVVHGRIRHEDDLVDTTAESLAGRDLRGRPAPVRGHASRSRTTGPFGYTVRVLPKQRAPRVGRPSWAASPCRTQPEQVARSELAEHDQRARARCRCTSPGGDRLADRVPGVGAEHDLAGAAPTGCAGSVALPGVGVRVEPEQERRVPQLARRAGRAPAAGHRRRTSRTCAGRSSNQSASVISRPSGWIQARSLGPPSTVGRPSRKCRWRSAGCSRRSRSAVLAMS